MRQNEKMVHGLMPESVELALTGRNNPGRIYPDTSGLDKRELSTTEWVAVLQDLSYFGVQNLTLTGGEPLLRDDFPELVREIGRGQCRFQLFSDGMHLTENIARLLQESRCCDYVQLTLEGLQLEHDALRGEGAFEKALAALRILADFNIKTVLLLTVGRHNIGRMKDIIEYLIHKVGVEHLRTHILSPCQRNWPLAPDEREILHWLDELRDHMPSVGTKMIRKQQKKNTNMSCPSLPRKLAVRADGMVQPCLYLPETILGNALLDSFIDIWKSPKAKRLRGNGDCEFAPHCGLGC